ncbi:hypothetical protein DFP73DRAFT_582879 [Morchella snyderi]|nr:hypothetical protein DFP73DRAFT_582879 [Morchella snyderi]
METRPIAKYSSVPQDTSIQKDWCPFPLRYYCLLPLILLCFIFCVGLEFLVHSCNPNGCQLPKPGGALVALVSLFLAVFIGFACGIIHHDCMRMEPWYQLSKGGGAAPEDSLFLAYSYAFLPLIPFMAAKKRHFIVLASSCMLLTSMVLTPFVVSSFSVASFEKLSVLEALYPVKQWEEITTDIDTISVLPYYRSYMRGWFNSSLPELTTAEYALEPWSTGTGLSIKNVQEAGPHDTPWTGITVLYEADLECEEARRTPVTMEGGAILGYNLTSSRPGYYSLLWDPGMVDANDALLISQLNPEEQKAYNSRNISYEQTLFQPGPTAYYNLALQVIPISGYGNLTESGAYIWASGRSPSENSAAATRLMLPPRWTTIFCFPSYYVSHVNVSVQLPSGIVLPINKTTTDRTRIPATRDITIETAPPTLVGTQLHDASSGYGVGLGPIPQFRPDSKGQVVKRFGGTGDQPRVKSGHLPPMNIEGDRLIPPDFALHSKMDAKMKSDAWRVDGLWCRFTETALAIIAMMVVWIIVLGKDRPCHLDGEPNSLASALAILHRSSALLKQLEGSEFRSMATVEDTWVRSRSRYRLVLEPDVGPRVEVKEAVGPPLVDLSGAKVADTKKSTGYETWDDIWPISSYAGAFFVILFGLIMIILSALYVASEKYDVGRHYSMLGPYMPLRRGRARSKTSLLVDYDKSPPHFQIIRCIRSGDWTFAALIISIFLSDVHANSFGLPSLTGNFSGMDMMVMHYAVSGYLSNEIKTPPWTTSTYYIVSFELADADNRGNVDSITATTFGLGANVSCSFVPTRDITSYCLSVSPTTGNVSKGDISECQDPLQHPDHATNLEAYTMVTDPCWPVVVNETRFAPLGSPKPLQWNIPVGDGLVAGPGCPSTFFAAWMEFNTYPGYRQNPNISVLRCNITHQSVTIRANHTNDTSILGSPVSVGMDTPLSEDLVATFVNQSAVSAAAKSGSLGFLGLQWYNSHLASSGSRVAPDGRNLTHIPESSTLPAAFEDVIAYLYATGLNIYATEFFHVGAKESITAQATFRFEWLLVRAPALWLIFGIVGYDTLVIGLLYWGPQGKRKVGHPPTCLVAIWAHLYASDAKELCGEIRGANIKARLAKLDKVGTRFTYGGFIGMDGNHHVGVFVEPESEETKNRAFSK